MSENKDNGGPAFPLVEPAGEMCSVSPGMSLRDYFAAKAMQGDIASMVDPSGERCGIQIDLPDENLKRLADMYYRMADALLETRK